MAVNVPGVEKFPAIPVVVAGATIVWPVLIVTALRLSVPELVIVVVPGLVAKVVVPALAVRLLDELTIRLVVAPEIIMPTEAVTAPLIVSDGKVGAAVPESECDELGKAVVFEKIKVEPA